MTVVARQKRFILSVDSQIKGELRKLLGSTPVTLASGSPRRKEILTLAGIECRVVVPRVNEDISADTEPRQFAIDIALRKLESVPPLQGITVAADTIVVLDERILGKPVGEGDAKRILQLLSGKRHYVITALTLRDDLSGMIVADTEKSYVTFHRLDEDDIETYVTSGEPMDKAGAYGIQGMGELLVDGLDGSLHNVIGFPIELFLRLIKELKR